MLMWDDNDEGLLKTEGKVWRTYLAFISSVCSNVVRPNNKQICLMKREITSFRRNSKSKCGGIGVWESDLLVNGQPSTMRNIAFYRQSV
jgi:hypothetical protein